MPSHQNKPEADADGIGGNRPVVYEPSALLRRDDRAFISGGCRIPPSDD